MDTPILLITIAFMVIAVMLVFAFSGPDEGRASKRRLAKVTERLAPSNENVLAAQMRKTIAARLPSQELALAKLLPNRERMAMRLRRTGRKWTLSQYMVVNLSAIAFILLALVIQGAPLLLSALIAICIGAGLPHIVISKMINRRLGQFTARFPDAIDLLVRGLRSGLPVTETMQSVSSEVPGPVGVEFKQVIERVRIGKSMEVALQDTADTLGTPEFQFFCITLAIQRETGGNLAETLSNLSEVLRKRAQMKLKIKAMSSEAKASAWIVGALPFCVFTMLWLMSPDYVAPFFPWSDTYDQRVMFTGMGGMVWMSIGVGIMAKMVAFEI